jgi:hypothetical protein
MSFSVTALHRFGLACLLGCTAMLPGCVYRDLTSLRTGFEKSRLPVHLDRDDFEDESVISVSVNGKEQRSFSFTDQDSVPFSVRNNDYTADVSLLFETGGIHYGLQLGLSPTDYGLVRLGGFWGFKVSVAPYLVTTMTAGLFMNRSVNHAKYAQTEGALFLYTTTEDSASGNVGHRELPVRVNFIFPNGSMASPYLSYGANLIRIGVRRAGADVFAQEVSAGALVDLPHGHGLVVEGSVSQDRVIGRNAIAGDITSGMLRGVRVAYVKRL